MDSKVGAADDLGINDSPGKWRGVEVESAVVGHTYLSVDLGVLGEERPVCNLKVSLSMAIGCQGRSVIRCLITRTVWSERGSSTRSCGMQFGWQYISQHQHMRGYALFERWKPGHDVSLELIAQLCCVACGLSLAGFPIGSVEMTHTLFAPKSSAVPFSGSRASAT